MKKTIITVVGKDTVGIIARVCTYLAENNVNVLDITQTIVQGFFNMMMVVDANNSTKEFEDLARRAWSSLAEPLAWTSAASTKTSSTKCTESENRPAKGTADMINIFEANETNKMITQENLDVRTITMGISLSGLYRPMIWIQLNQNDL